jgi:riboflavin kinase/FMN adenylyltransferase
MLPCHVQPVPSAPVKIDGERVSSSGVRAALAAGDLERAARWLGRRYSMQGRVIRGERH